MHDIALTLFVLGIITLIIALVYAFHAFLLQFNYFQGMPHIKAWITMTMIGLGATYLWVKWCIYLCNLCTF